VSLITDRKIAFDKISNTLAIIRLDIEHHQAINDVSLNIHGENYFRDVFNFVYSCNFVNANLEKSNTPYIDLVDTENRKLIQITTTRNKEKILKTLQALLCDTYQGYDIAIYYLLDKAMPTQATIDEIKNIHPNIILKDILNDYKGLIRDIEALETNRLIELAHKYFTKQAETYTDEMVLDLTIKKLLQEYHKIPISYDDDLTGLLGTSEKLQINHINHRIANKINGQLDYTQIIGNMSQVKNLRKLIIDDFYKNILIIQLKSKVSMDILLEKPVNKLQKLASEQHIDFNKLIYVLHCKIDKSIMPSDFNSMTISWIIVAYFFEICDVGIKEHDNAK